MRGGLEVAVTPSGGWLTADPNNSKQEAVESSSISTPGHSREWSNIGLSRICFGRGRAGERTRLSGEKIARKNQ